MSFQEFLILSGYPLGVFSASWRNLSRSDKLLLEKEWEQKRGIK